ncbi:MAG: glutathione peroxidase [Vallitaleaceae bacterium]|nr:glutathione peroxidase [Vallitaleaceae bacterium]
MNVYDFNVKTIDGQEVSLDTYKGKVLLIVNTASKCGFTPQFKELEELYKTYNKEGLEILGFPCNQFASQDPGNDEEIKNFCTLNYDVSFPMFSKIDVNGESAHPLYKHLQKEASGLLGDGIKWNFTKFLVDTEGKVVDRFPPTKTPLKLKKDIEKLLG